MIWATAKQEASYEWNTALTNVCEMLDDSFTNSKKILEQGYEEEFVCEGGCYCEEISGTYIDHVRLEREIEREINDVKDKIKQLVQQRKDILTTCPDYEETQYAVPAAILESM